MDVFRQRYGDHEWVAPDDPAYDVLIVNGEGTMHHSQPGHHRKMRRIKAAVRDGRPAYLLNSVWQQNDATYDALLPQISAIQVRERLSAIDLATHGVAAQVHPDLSWYAPVDPNAQAPDWTDQIVATDCYLGPRSWGVPKEFAGVTIADMSTMSWSAFVVGLSTARLLITGRHHAVYAACRAGIPFVAIAGNSHKTDGLMRSADVPVTVLRAPPTIDAAERQAEREARCYPELFAWLKAQPLALPSLA